MVWVTRFFGGHRLLQSHHRGQHFWCSVAILDLLMRMTLFGLPRGDWISLSMRHTDVVLLSTRPIGLPEVVSLV